MYKCHSLSQYTMLFLDFQKKVIHELIKIENLLKHRIHCCSGKIEPEDFYNKCENVAFLLALHRVNQ